jgi:very-short-patch-repair endonuclease
MVNRLVPKARQLRRRATEAEKKLWKHLRARQLEGVKFRRQEPIGRYIVDFVALEKKRVIEVDGGQHAVEKERDRKRDEWLEHEGFEILRIWNNDIFDNLNGVLEREREILLYPSPSPSHKGRGAIRKNLIRR